MDITTYTEFRQKLANFLDRIEANRKPLIVTRQNSPSVVVICQRDNHQCGYDSDWNNPSWL